ncbi:MAG: hypothetical protein LM560_00205 [Desulfurococcaceae archaeon]|jgi:hypothetical protein|nr:hypothetical protein [Desulfurococcaceae archaeon]
MAYFEVLNEVQEITLRHERLVNRLRVELSKVSSGSHNEDLIKDLVEDLRRTRRVYSSVTSKVSSIELKDGNVGNDLYTLLEYNVLIALNNELELLKILSKHIRRGKIKSIELDDIVDDVSHVNEILASLSNSIGRTS